MESLGITYAGYVAYLIACIYAVIGCTKTHPEFRGKDNTNIYGVDTVTGRDEIFKHVLIRAIVITSIGTVIALICGMVRSSAGTLDRIKYEFEDAISFPYNFIYTQEYSHSGKSYINGELTMGNYTLWMCIMPIISIVVFCCIGLLPVKIARRYEHNQTTAIAWLTFFFGGTIIIWIVMFIWASKASNTSKTVNTKSSTDKIRELQNMLDQGLITKEEFESKRKELIERI